MKPRYSYEGIRDEIQAFIDRGPRGTQKRLALAADLDQSGFRHRMSQREGMRFSIEELSAICQEADGKTGWPFLSWDEAERVDAVLRLIRGQD